MVERVGKEREEEREREGGRGRGWGIGRRVRRAAVGGTWYLRSPWWTAYWMWYPVLVHLFNGPLRKSYALFETLFSLQF